MNKTKVETILWDTLYFSSFRKTLMLKFRKCAKYIQTNKQTLELFFKYLRNRSSDLYVHESYTRARIYYSCEHIYARIFMKFKT